MNRRRGVGLVGLAMTVLLVASACQQAGEEPKEAEKTGGTFRVYLSEPSSLDPYQGDTSEEVVVTKQIFEGLTTYDDETVATEPGMATRWEQNDDSTVFTFTLRRDAKFSNGEAVTAESFVRGWSRASAKAENTNLGYWLSGVKGYKEQFEDGTTTTLAGVKAKDQYTLEVTLSEPDPEFITKVAHTAFSPMPSDAAFKGQQPSFAEFPVGNGPFMVKEPHKHNQSVTLVPNPNYKGGRPSPKLAEVVFVILPDLDTAYLEWQAGNLEFTRIPPAKYGEAETNNPGNYIEKTMAGLNYLGPINNKAPSDNKLFRQAVSLAVDREAINQAVFNGLNQPADSIVPPLMPGYRKGACKYCKYDPAQAKQLYQQSGLKLEKLTMHFNSGAGHEAWMQAVADQVKNNLGIPQVELIGVPPPFGNYLKMLGGPQSPGTAPGSINRLAWGLDYPSPHNFLFGILGANSADNHVSYVSKPFEDLLAAASKESDVAKRIKIYQQAEDVALEDLGLIPMWFRVQNRLVKNDKFTGIGIDAFEFPTLTKIAPK